MECVLLYAGRTGLLFHALLPKNTPNGFIGLLMILFHQFRILTRPGTYRQSAFAGANVPRSIAALIRSALLVGDATQDYDWTWGLVVSATRLLSKQIQSGIWVLPDSWQQPCSVSKALVLILDRSLCEDY